MIAARAPIEHDLKVWPPYFQEVYQGRKNFEVRLNDRDFRQFDILRLREFYPLQYDLARLKALEAGHTRQGAHEQGLEAAYSGRECRRLVGYVMFSGDPAVLDMEAAHAGIAPGYVLMSLSTTPEAAQAKHDAWYGRREGRCFECSAELIGPFCPRCNPELSFRGRLPSANEARA